MESFLENLVEAVIKTVVSLWPFLSVSVPFGVLALIGWLVGLPMRRAERARLFLELLELGLKAGHTAEQSIIRPAASGDRMLGRQFLAFARYIEGGLPFAEGLKYFPRLLPANVQAMLLAGLEAGRPDAILPACRQALQDGLAQTRGAIHYLAILVFVVLPIVPLCTITLVLQVLPKFALIAQDMGLSTPASSQLVFAFGGEFIALQIIVMLAGQFLMFCYLAGPHLRRLTGDFAGVIDRLLWLLPWRRQRARRDFASTLAMLLDAGVGESRSLQLAAECANSRVLLGRARRALERLALGESLPEAVRRLDDSGELHWRIRNAAQGSQGFLPALRGWFESLDARAFRQEQAAAQVVTTAVVLWNALVVGFFVVGVFHVLTNLIEEAVLW